MALILSNLKQKKYLIQAIIFFSLILVIYFVLDYLNMGYSSMIKEYGLYLVIINIALNITMALISSILLVTSELLVNKSKSSNLSFVAIIFGMFTYGCTTCLILFLSNIGIIFTVIALPLAGLPYKLISVGLILLGLFLTTRQIKRGCNVKLNI